MAKFSWRKKLHAGLAEELPKLPNTKLFSQRPGVVRGDVKPGEGEITPYSGTSEAFTVR